MSLAGSLAGDVLKAAAEKQQALATAQLAELQERSQALTDAIRRPWATRVAAIAEAAAMVREASAQPRSVQPSGTTSGEAAQ